MYKYCMPTQAKQATCVLRSGMSVVWDQETAKSRTRLFCSIFIQKIKSRADDINRTLVIEGDLVLFQFNIKSSSMGYITGIRSHDVRG